MPRSMIVIKLIFSFKLVLIILSLQCPASTSSSLIMKLTHRDNSNSPLYQPNISDFDRLLKHIEISRSRGSYFQQIKKQSYQTSKNQSFHLPLTYYEPLFTVELSFGTPPVKRTLIFDTGSGLTWTQCRPCLMCFKQEQPLFDTKNSTSYKTLKPSDALAKKNFNCFFNGCYYYVLYSSLQFSSGVASVESFHFQTSHGATESHPFVFGCGAFSRGTYGSTNKITGIFGMDKQPVSLARQLGDVIKHRFSYCFPAIGKNHTKESYLRFGDEAVIRGRYGKVQRTSFLKGRRDIFYQLKLIDLSVDNKRLGLPLATFATNCIIDSGASVSLLNRRAFASLTMRVDEYFGNKDVRRYKGRDVPKGFVCYTKKPSGRPKFPSVTFHFEGADFHVPAANLFLVEDKFVCLMIIGSGSTNLLGAYQQQNVRVVYDLKEELLSFAPEDCSREHVVG